MFCVANIGEGDDNEFLIYLFFLVSWWAKETSRAFTIIETFLLRQNEETVISGKAPGWSEFGDS